MSRFKKDNFTLKDLTFSPRSGDRYHCKQVKKTVTKKGILGLIMAHHHGGTAGQVLRIGPAGPPKSTKQKPKKHASKFAQKHR